MAIDFLDLTIDGLNRDFEYRYQTFKFVRVKDFYLQKKIIKTKKMVIHANINHVFILNFSVIC